MTLAEQGGAVRELCGDPFDVLRAQVTAETVVDVPDLPRFKGGAVGMFGYDMVRFIEKLPDTAENLIGTPDMVMLFSDELVIFDHVKHRLMVMVNLDLTSPDLDRAYADTCRRINAVCERIHAPFAEPDLPAIRDDSPWACSQTPEEYAEIVRRTREYIIAGDIFQGVLSMRQRRATRADPFTIYRALRMVNPSSYMFYLDFSRIPGVEGRRCVWWAQARRCMCGWRTAGPACTRLRDRAGAAKPRKRTGSWRTTCWRIPRNGPSTSCWSTWAATTWAASATTDRCRWPT